MTAAQKRTLIGTETGLASRQRVYETDEGLIVESTDQYEISRKSVLFEDVVLVTHHREFGRVYVIVLSLIAAVILAAAALMYAGDAPLQATGITASFALPFLIALAIRMAMKVDVVSVFGRRSRASIRFAFRKRRAREVYGRICYRTRQAQRVPEEISQTQSAE